MRDLIVRPVENGRLREDFESLVPLVLAADPLDLGHLFFEELVVHHHGPLRQRVVRLAVAVKVRHVRGQRQDRPLEDFFFPAGWAGPLEDSFLPALGRPGPLEDLFFFAGPQAAKSLMNP